MSPVTNDDSPGYSGAHILRGAIEASQRAPHLKQAIDTRVQSLAARIDDDEPIDALDQDVQALIHLITEAGVAAPPLLPHRGWDIQEGPTIDVGEG
jgi:hypothetical protein